MQQSYADRQEYAITHFFISNVMGNKIKESSTNQANRRILSDRCRVNDTLSLVGKRWLMTILYEISLGNNQFSTLTKSIPEISEHVLATRVNNLVENNLIEKNERMNTTPLQIIYSITDKGKQLLLLVDSLCKWDGYWNS
ncbi:helix-turn-helix transcriptional regulator [Elizabethkingia meningoseptica]|uniref:winged helix-turn-helix transcriptional regulator n=2 Tax=Elizabethkingia meningoseptica TaxID=238 RepID=UPI0023B1E8C1|nr:helix-turn-helix domain-containing protein [Elizabethkingia meningoseptica]MDE5437584.1 helix-turn-helix transcriptional regulator [Elizabethkingia meningoseptica]MDE5468010.1 helix-turn-helix transcriptional regulator [Elizabethkingia meningoseptica]MDE5474929.1 helix-turn-helix transcriptional regulator [Elizabethkingia meningoseptica]MDE5478362.1 helix-turn-helix transcriptional regulator [Elizabethkingia meningoseptica]MDE5501646.1 helix-turn-helix transcriptional regulator [Elizabethki